MVASCYVNRNRLIKKHSKHAKKIKTRFCKNSAAALSERAWSLGLKVGVSFFKFSNSADFGEALSRFDFFKVPSAELLNQTLIESLAALGG